MKLLLLAALSQANAAPETDVYREALRCRNAIAITSYGTDDLYAGAVQAAYFVILAADAGSGTTMLERLNAVNEDMGDIEGVVREGPAAVLAACDRRYPLARRTGPVALPADPFDRDMMCASILSLLAGIARGEQNHNGNAANVERLAPVARAYQGRMSAALIARRVDNEGAARLAGEQLSATLRIGNPGVIEQACAAQLR